MNTEMSLVRLRHTYSSELFLASHFFLVQSKVVVLSFFISKLQSYGKINGQLIFYKATALLDSKNTEISLVDLRHSSSYSAFFGKSPFSRTN